MVEGTSEFFEVDLFCTTLRGRSGRRSCWLMRCGHCEGTSCFSSAGLRLHRVGDLFDVGATEEALECGDGTETMEASPCIRLDASGLHSGSHDGSD